MKCLVWSAVDLILSLGRLRCHGISFREHRTLPGALPGTQRFAQTFEYLSSGLCDLSIHSAPQNVYRNPRERPQIFIYTVSVTQALRIRPPEMFMIIPFRLSSEISQFCMIGSSDSLPTASIAIFHMLSRPS